MVIDLKDTINAVFSHLEDVIVEAEDSDQIVDEDVRADLIEALEEAQSSLADALLVI